MFNIPSCSWREALATEVKTIDEDPFMCSGAYTLEKGDCSQEHRTFLSQQALPEPRGSRKPARLHVPWKANERATMEGQQPEHIHLQTVAACRALAPL